MKRLAATIVVLVALACTAQAEISTATTNYFTNAFFVASTGNYSNSTGGLVIGFEVAELLDLTDAQASNSVGELLFNMMALFNDKYQALAVTNRPVNVSISENFSSDSSTSADYRVVHSLTTKHRIDARSIPTE